MDYTAFFESDTLNPVIVSRKAQVRIICEREVLEPRVQKKTLEELNSEYTLSTFKTVQT